MSKLTFSMSMCTVLLLFFTGSASTLETTHEEERPWLDNFDLQACTQLTDGKNRFFILSPGHQIVLASKTEQVFITVLKETLKINGIETRIIEEREFEDGSLKEVSRNYFTICKEHNDVFYHGEDVDEYKEGQVVGHGGSWRAGVNGAKAGLMMPGKPVVGMRHYQEVAPKVAMDRAEIVEDAVTLEAPSKKYKHALRVVETTPLEAGASTKIYVPDVGLAFDDGMVIVDHGKDRVPPEKPMDLKIDVASAYAETEVALQDMPAAAAEMVAKLHPKGEIREVKRETRANGQSVYALEVFVDGQQHDVEITPEGNVLRNQKE